MWLSAENSNGLQGCTVDSTRHNYLRKAGRVVGAVEKMTRVVPETSFLSLSFLEV